MKFHLTADAQFEAHDLNDALGQLTQHFADLMGGQPDGESLEFDGRISIGEVGPVGIPGALGPVDTYLYGYVKRPLWRRLLGAVGWRA